MKTHFILHTLRKECTHCLKFQAVKIHFTSFSQQSLQLQGIDRDPPYISLRLFIEWLTSYSMWLSNYEWDVCPDRGGLSLRRTAIGWSSSGESADSLPAAMWKVEVEGIKLRFTIFLTFDQFYILKLWHTNPVYLAYFEEGVYSAGHYQAIRPKQGPCISQSLYPQLSLFQSANLYSGPVSPHQWSLWSGRRYHCQWNSNTDLYSRLSPN